ncbi:MAG TPA: hypothetical protein VI362_09220 [Ignavibacteriaceae bacterium]|nr:hypothetical protein [Ignavibacteriaceae bacterium]
MGKAILIVILGSIVLLGTLNMNTNRYLNSDTENSVDFYADAHARNIACSMTQMLLSQIADNMAYKTSGTQQSSFFGGNTEYSVSRVLFAGDSLTRVQVTANYMGKARQVTAYCKPGGWTPPFLRGAWTANGNLNQTISDMYIDGRDYKLDGTIVPTNGMYGVSTSVPFVNTYFAAIGGTNNLIDYPMQFPENPNIIEQYNWGGNFPETPDEILGYPEGTLKGIAQSKVSGSQYVTNVSSLVFPLSGVTYVDLPANSSVDLDLKYVSSTANKGILIVHAPNRSSKVNHLKSEYPNKTNSIPFKGIIITDYSFHHHLNILGAVLQLSPNLELSKICNGNKDHWVHFSREAIINATEVVAKNSKYSGNNNWGGDNVYAGLGPRRYHVKYWYE